MAISYLALGGAHSRIGPGRNRVIACYCRVSSTRQRTDSQKPEIRRWLQGNGIGLSTVEWFEDKETGGTLRLCNTTTVLMGGQSNGCVPTTDGTAPTLTACGGGLGSGQVKQTGSSVFDWTAPNENDVTTLSDGDSDPAHVADWTNIAGPEDLALWSESGATTSSTTAVIGGNGAMHVQGVFMVPNYQPLTITGGAVLDLVNAQFIATSLELNGNTSVNLSVDPNAAVTLAKLTLVGLVR